MGDGIHVLRALAGKHTRAGKEFGKLIDMVPSLHLGFLPVWLFVTDGAYYCSKIWSLIGWLG